MNEADVKRSIAKNLRVEASEVSEVRARIAQLILDLQQEGLVREEEIATYEVGEAIKYMESAISFIEEAAGRIEESSHITIVNGK